MKIALKNPAVNCFRKFKRLQLTFQGVAITRVDPNGALGQAGVEVQDILLALDGQPIEGVDSLTVLIAGLKPHQRITVSALDHRSGNTGDVAVVVR